jgi:drug/metabolite transporter (DMT)-like permease
MTATSRPADDPLAPVPQADPQADPALGILYMVVSISLFGIMDAAVKWLGATYPTMQIVFFRSLFAFVPLVFLIFSHGSIKALRVTRPLGHVVRSLVGLAAMTIFFYAYSVMPLADVVAIGFAAPLFITALSIPLLGESVGVRRWTAVVVGFVGVLIMVNPGAGMFDPLAIIPLIGTVFYSLAIIFVRKLSRTETNVSIVFYFSLTATVVAAAFLPFHWVTPNLPDLALLVGVGLLGGLAQITMTNAFRAAAVSIIMPFEYLVMAWAAGLGYLIWDEVPGLNIWIGVAIVAASGLYIVYREAHLGLPRGVGRRLHAKR